MNTLVQKVTIKQFQWGAKRVKALTTSGGA